MPRDPEGEWEWPSEEHQALHYAFLTGEDRHLLPNDGYPQPILCDDCDEHLADRCGGGRLDECLTSIDAEDNACVGCSQWADCGGQFREECEADREDAEFHREQMARRQEALGG